MFVDVAFRRFCKSGTGARPSSWGIALVHSMRHGNFESFISAHNSTHIKKMQLFNTKNRIAKYRPNIVHSMCLLDPVCLLLHLPKLAYNFCYKPVSWTSANISNTIRYYWCVPELGCPRFFNFPYIFRMNQVFKGAQHLQDNVSALLVAIQRNET